ncbi:spindle pole body formation-associated protein-domain-containing protein [Xylariales sp. PMI_506]|nr:spindle pole body formation-associated protein-domain-containing protein [Xylariales sp. PMI_506]
MLGWALKKGIQSATGTNALAESEGDTTQIEAPDTPAPVFAARAIRHALFGTPAPGKEPSADDGRVDFVEKSDDATTKDMRSPAKPAGILLTPGTATARRKRVSFDRDVKAGTKSELDLLASNISDSAVRKKSAIQQRLENSRSIKSKKPSEELPKPKKAEPTQTQPTETMANDSDEEWEDDVCNHDVTVDLNEPHSKSGKYWKSEFNKYTEDARTEMEKLVKYKHLAKRYAQQKDAEAVDLNQKLKEEQAKVLQMEKTIAEMAARAGKQGGHSDGETSALMKKLAEKTALAIQYRDQAKELEALLLDQEAAETPHRRRINTSPRTEKTLLEVNRELRRARSELKEMNSLREEVERLKSDLLFAQQRAAKLGEENKRIAEDVAQPSLIKRLEKQLKESKDDTQRKADELSRVRKEFDSLKENAKGQRRQALQVLREKNDRISELEREVKALKEKESSTAHRRSLETVAVKHDGNTREPQSGVASLHRRMDEEKPRPRLQPRRAASAEDLTLDLTQNSRFGDAIDVHLNGNAKGPARRRRSSLDLTASLLEIQEELAKEKQQHIDARRRERCMLTNDYAKPVSNSLEKQPHLSAGQRRVMSDRVNESSPKGITDRARSRRVTSTHSALGTDKDIMRGVLDNITTSRYPSRTTVDRILTESTNSPGIDLVQNRFARLGGFNPNDTVLTANMSRCTLPAERQAAARARLEQKRRERQNFSIRVNDKENMGL